jgi:acetyl esterase
MPLDARLQPVLDAKAAAPPPPPGATTAQRRALADARMEEAFVAFGEPGPEVASITERRVPVEGGEIGLRVYRPAGDGPFPAHLYLHGGGFWMGRADQFDATCCETAAGAGCVVASVDYRLAPEHRFPVAAEDCYAALVWLRQHATELEVDPSRISVGGGSAGGGLTASVTLMARDRGGPPLVFQVVEIPVVDHTSWPAPSGDDRRFVSTRPASADDHDTSYLGDPADATHPYASPLLAEDLSGLPPALVMTAELDPLCEQGEAYAARLVAAGVPTTLRRWDGQIHGFASYGRLVPDVAKEYRDTVHLALRAAYGD